MDAITHHRTGGHLTDYEIQARREIVARGIWIFAWWKDGQQMVGDGHLTLKEAQRKITTGELDNMLSQAGII